MTALTRRDATFGAALLVCVLFSFGLQVVSLALWCCAGVVAWSFAWTVSGRLRTREPVEDNVRIVRHQSFVITALCLGVGLVGALEAVVASLVQPWWLQLLANAGLTLLVFHAGCGVFGRSHDWVLEDPTLDKPLFLLDVCVVS